MLRAVTLDRADGNAIGVVLIEHLAKCELHGFKPVGTNDGNEQFHGRLPRILDTD